MKCVIHPAFQSLTEFIQQLPSIFDQAGTTIYKARNEIKVFEVDGIRLNVKRYKVPYLFNRFAYTFLRQPKAVRAFEYANLLLEKGINTPTPVAYLLFNRGGMLAESYFVSLQAEGETLYEIGKAPLKGNENFYLALGQYTARLHQHQIFHRDYSPGNILYRKTGEAYDFSLVDINRMEFGAVSLKKGCANFARLWGSPEALRLAIKAYAAVRQCDEQTCITYMERYRNRFWNRYLKKHPKPF